MSDAIDNIEKRGRGRPRTDATPILVRFPPDELEALDRYREALKPPMSRQEAIRSFVRWKVSPETRGEEAAWGVNVPRAPKPVRPL